MNEVSARSIQFDEQNLREFEFPKNWFAELSVPSGTISSVRYRLSVFLTRLKEVDENLFTLGDVWLNGYGSDLNFRIDCFVRGSGQRESNLDPSAWVNQGNCNFPMEVTTISESEVLAVTTLWDTIVPTVPPWGAWQSAKGEVNGDRWGIWASSRGSVVLVSDGLGSGPKAAEASRRAARTVRTNRNASIEELMNKTHDNLKSTRGAAVFLGRISHSGRQVKYCSIGNITARHLGKDGMRFLLDLNGIVGYKLPSFSTRTCSLEKGDFLVMHTDGVEIPSSQLSRDELADCRPNTTSARLLLSYKKDEDDALVGTIKIPGNQMLW